MGRSRWLASTLAVVLIVTMSVGGTSAAQPPAPTGAAGLTVTLVTGDRVTITPTSRGRPTAAGVGAPWPGRRVSFHTMYIDGALRVLPSDVAHLVPQVLDPQLFDVSGLIRAGYHDAVTAELPLIIRRASAAAFAAGRLRASRELPSIAATPTTLPKTQAATLGATLTAGSASALAGMRIWLDAKVHSGELDRNLIQIGAPAAWDAGLSGAGVPGAELATGAHDTHPDLAGQVSAEENFTDSPVADDRNGHGTHVASLVAGTGAAAGGARRGVAFGASLLSG
ncbi:MAG: S8 family serine peptidase, partial [Micromonosporaceae bacterium]